MDLSILIVNWNTRAYTTQCLQSLADTADRVSLNPDRTLPYGDYSAEVIVVDNASTDEQRFGYPATIPMGAANRK